MRDRIVRCGSAKLEFTSAHLAVQSPCLLYPRKRTYAVQYQMSALCQWQTSAASLDHLVRAPDERVRNVDPERLGSLEVDVKLDLGCLLDRKIGGPLTLEDAASVNPGLTSPKPRRNELRADAASLGDRPLRKPITGIAGCCPRAARGHELAAAAPPTTPRNSRRLISAPRLRRRDRAPQTSALIEAETKFASAIRMLLDVRFGSLADTQTMSPCQRAWRSYGTK